LLKFLVIQTASLGDVILSTPVLEKLHHYYPDASIDLLVKRGNEDLFRGHPFLRSVIVWNKSRGKYHGLLSLRRRLRKERYDHLINIQRFASSGFLTAFSGAGHTIGFDKNPFSWLFNTKVKHRIGERGIHETQRNLSLVDSITGEGDFQVRLYPGEEDFARVSTYKDSPYITIAPASLWYTKQYPKGKWVDFLVRLPKKFNVFYLGSRNDFELCSSIIKESGRGSAVNLAGGLSFLETAALMKDAVMNYVNDSAPQHLASAVNAPVTAVFCSTIPEFGFGPLSDNAAIIETDKNLACRPCGLHGLNACPEKHFDCAMTIDTEKLLKRLP
jgi:heptosyltransferase-2